jgi:hypothetical protein
MAEQLANVDRTTALYERSAMSVQDETAFAAVKQAIAERFAPQNVAEFLRTLESGKLRVREFEAVLECGKLGGDTAAEYGKLSDGDQGQIREFYLASLEQVELPLRDRFFKLYAYY